MGMRGISVLMSRATLRFRPRAHLLSLIRPRPGARGFFPALAMRRTPGLSIAARVERAGESGRHKMTASGEESRAPFTRHVFPLILSRPTKEGG